ncbi:19892_t:CDS:1, partial [Racocetra fulgida]
MKGDFQTIIINTQQTSTYDCSDDDDFFQALEKKVSGNSSVADEEDE